MSVRTRWATQICPPTVPRHIALPVPCATSGRTLAAWPSAASAWRTASATASRSPAQAVPLSGACSGPSLVSIVPQGQGQPMQQQRQPSTSSLVSMRPRTVELVPASAPAVQCRRDPAASTAAMLEREDPAMQHPEQDREPPGMTAAVTTPALTAGHRLLTPAPRASSTARLESRSLLRSNAAKYLTCCLLTCGYVAVRRACCS